MRSGDQFKCAQTVGSYRRVDVCKLELIFHIPQHYFGDLRRHELHCGYWHVGLEPSRLAQVSDDGGVELEGEQRPPTPHSHSAVKRTAGTEEV